MSDRAALLEVIDLADQLLADLTYFDDEDEVDLRNWGVNWVGLVGEARRTIRQAKAQGA